MDSKALVKRLAAPVYGPIFLAYLGLGMLVVALPLYMTNADLSLRATSIVLATSGAGAAAGAIPMGEALARFGERFTARGAVFILATAAALLGLTTNPAVLTVLMFFNGMGIMAFLLSLQTLVTRSVLVNQRGRAMSYMGGTFRVSFLIGPFLGGFLADQVGFATTFLITSAVLLSAVIPTLRPEHSEHAYDTPVPDRSTGVLPTLRKHRRLVTLAGVAQLLVMLVREGRLVVMPLIGDDLGLTATQTGLLVTVSTAADLVLFPFSGWIMDRHGRLFAVVPAFLVVAAGLVLLGVAQSATQAVVAGAVIGVGNGLGSGTMLTLASDLAPPDATGPFLAGLASIRNLGRIIGPLSVGFMGDAVGLDGSALLLAALMVLGVAWIVLLIGETSKHPHALATPTSTAGTAT